MKASKEPAEQGGAAQTLCIKLATRNLSFFAQLTVSEARNIPPLIVQSCLLHQVCKPTFVNKNRLENRRHASRPSWHFQGNQAIDRHTCCTCTRARGPALAFLHEWRMRVHKARNISGCSRCRFLPDCLKVSLCMNGPRSHSKGKDIWLSRKFTTRPSLKAKLSSRAAYIRTIEAHAQIGQNQIMHRGNQPWKIHARQWTDAVCTTIVLLMCAIEQ